MCIPSPVGDFPQAKEQLIWEKDMKIHQILATAAMLVSLSANAHTHLQKSMPADKSVVTAAPSVVVLTFSEAANVTALTLQKGTDKAQPLGPLPEKAAKEVTVALPALIPGEYVVNWRVAGKDSHVMSGRFAFTLAASTVVPASKPQQP